MRARLFSITALLALAAPAGLAQTSVEHAVKAAYLAKFAPFIDWPEKAFDGPTAPLTICVLGPDPLGADLDKAASDQKDGDHPLVVRRLAAPEPDARCQIVFLPDAGQADQALAEMKNKPVVTVTDSGLRAHGVISFVIIDNHVRFDIDNEAANAAGLAISSKLLALAHAVRQKGAR